MYQDLKYTDIQFDQKHILGQLARFVAQRKNIVQAEYDKYAVKSKAKRDAHSQYIIFLDGLIEKLVGPGYCAGLTVLWLFGVSLDEQKSTDTRERDDAERFFATLAKISTWDGKSLLSEELQKEFDVFLQKIEFYQNSNQYNPGYAQVDTIAQLEGVGADKKLTKFTKDRHIVGAFTLENFKHILGETIAEGRTIQIGSRNHVTGCYKAPGSQNILFYNPSSPSIVDATVGIDQALLAEKVFTAFAFKHDKPSPLSIVASTPHSKPALPFQKSIKEVLDGTTIVNGGGDPFYEDGHTGLTMAAARDNIECSEYYLERKFDQDTPTVDGLTALSFISAREQKFMKNTAHIFADEKMKGTQQMASLTAMADKHKKLKQLFYTPEREAYQKSITFRRKYWSWLMLALASHHVAENFSILSSSAASVYATVSRFSFFSTPALPADAAADQDDELIFSAF